ncbi:hypothetical protein HMPREF9997_02159, partial [Corynebacterium durum F0235]
TQVPRYSGLKQDIFAHLRELVGSEPKYRDIADGKHPCFLFLASPCVV